MFGVKIHLNLRLKYLWLRVIGCSIYNSDNNLISYNDIKAILNLLLKFQGLKFLKQQVICEWLPIQMSFQKGVDGVYMINDNLLSDKELYQTQNS